MQHKMKKILFISIIVLLIWGCNNTNNKTVENSSRFCENELDLLCSFDTLPTYYGDLKTINTDIEQKVSELFKGDICCQDLTFNVYHNFNSIDTIKISLNYYYNCDNCPVFIRARNVCVILQNSRGQILFEGEIIPIDSLDTELFNYYSKIGTQDFFPDSYDKANISLQWDLNVTDDDFRIYINQIIQGYLNFVNQFCLKTYNKEICELNQVELKNLGKIIPLKIEIPTIEVIEEEYELENELK